MCRDVLTDCETFDQVAVKLPARYSLGFRLIAPAPLIRRFKLLLLQSLYSLFTEGRGDLRTEYPSFWDHPSV